MNEELAAINEEYLATNEELAGSNQLLLRSNESLQRFSYVASHDLQEPLRKIQSFGDLVVNRYASKLGDGAEYLKRMQTAASRMSVLIDDLLTFSRISTYQEATTPVLLNDVLTQVLTDLELIIQETGATVNAAILPIVHGDQTQLNQLFQNLLSNALKFSSHDTIPAISITAEIKFANELPAHVIPTSRVAAYHRIDIADNGIGFDQKHVSRIFQVFQRLHGKNEFPGTGIGLAICERVVSNHGGAITARSQPGQGAVFSVYLPV
ncbi:ATP-binding protein [Dyadobacter sp. NIV53]|uniref:sensor histidine kinase n=1 Tax=Dyadobacter sp. NIV53 TaxID=2861765 RepID=UPI001C87D6C6|nr:ATP-binding protein [Dyadobacter sp. NIV53]